MSSKEPSIRLLRERYSESFAVTLDAEKGQAYLFLVKLGLWSLVYTFTKKEIPSESFGLSQVLQIIEDAMSGKNIAMRSRLDESVKKALDRIKEKVDEFSLGGSL